MAVDRSPRIEQLGKEAKYKKEDEKKGKEGEKGRWKAGSDSNISARKWVRRCQRTCSFSTCVLASGVVSRFASLTSDDSTTTRIMKHCASSTERSVVEEREVGHFTVGGTSQEKDASTARGSAISNAVSEMRRSESPSTRKEPPSPVTVFDKY